MPDETITNAQLAAAIQHLGAQNSVVQIDAFYGLPTEDWGQFERQLESAIGVSATTSERQKVQYMHLNLKAGALVYFDHLPAASKSNFKLAIQDMRKRYGSEKKQDLHKIVFQRRKYNPSKEAPEDFLTDLQRLAGIAFPDIVDATGNVTTDKKEYRTGRVREQFIEGMTYKHKSSLMKKPATDTVEDLCTSVSQKIILQDACPQDDANATAFNEVNESEMQTMINALSKLTTDVAEMKAEKAKPDMIPQQPRGNSNFRGRGRERGRYGSNYRPNYQANGYTHQNTQWRAPKYPWGSHAQQQQWNQATGAPQPPATQAPSSIYCYGCGWTGHIKRDCPYKPAPNTNAQIPYTQQRRSPQQFEPKN